MEAAFGHCSEVMWRKKVNAATLVQAAVQTCLGRELRQVGPLPFANIRRTAVCIALCGDELMIDVVTCSLLQTICPGEAHACISWGRGYLIGR
jgi:hypothetical protein